MEVDSNVVGCLLAVVLFIPAVLLQAWVLAHLWTWFVVPFGIMPLKLWHACGIRVLVGSFENNNTKSSENIWSTCIVMVAWPFVVLGCGWMYHWAMLHW